MVVSKIFVHSQSEPFKELRRDQIGYLTKCMEKEYVFTQNDSKGLEIDYIIAVHRAFELEEKIISMSFELVQAKQVCRAVDAIKQYKKTTDLRYLEEYLQPGASINEFSILLELLHTYTTSAELKAAKQWFQTQLSEMSKIEKGPNTEAKLMMIWKKKI